MTLATDILTLLPELIVACGAMLLLLWGALGGEKSFSVISAAAVVVLVVAGVAMFALPPANPMAFGGAFAADDYARFAKVLILIGSVCAILMSSAYLTRENFARFEFPVLILLSTVGMMLMVSANSFIALYMGLELQSLALYVLAAFHRDNARSSEAGLKYFVLGALSSGMMLYGISLIYGFTGSIDFAAVAGVVKNAGVHIGLIFGIVFFIVGVAFKVSVVPFHMWVPDVYEGAPTPVTAFFIMSPKVAAMALFVRAFMVAFPDALAQWQQILVFVSVLSMALGSVAAIGQSNIKRLMAYSTIGHMGYALIGLAAGSAAGVSSVLIYLTIYLATNAGVFVCILAMKRDGKNVETISDLAGLASTRPALAFIFAALMFSLAGIPPVAGFFAKFYVFLAAMEAHLYALAFIGVVASVVGAYYYLNIVKIMYFDDAAPAFDRGMDIGLKTVLGASGVFTLLFVVGAAPIISAANLAAKALFS